jgi:hypothetical protein
MTAHPRRPAAACAGLRPECVRQTSPLASGLSVPVGSPWTRLLPPNSCRKASLIRRLSNEHSPLPLSGGGDALQIQRRPLLAHLGPSRMSAFAPLLEVKRTPCGRAQSAASLHPQPAGAHCYRRSKLPSAVGAAGFAATRASHWFSSRNLHGKAQVCTRLVYSCHAIRVRTPVVAMSK